MISIRSDEACEKFEARLVGEGSFKITGVADPRSAIESTACFVLNPVYLPAVELSPAKFWVMSEEFFNLIDPKVREKKIFALTSEPYVFFARLAGSFFPEPVAQGGVHPQAYVHPKANVHATSQVDAFVNVGAGAVIAAHVILESGTHIGENAQIGEGSHLYSGVKIYERCVIGKRNILHSGVVIGADGFGFVKKDGKNFKIPQVGIVITKNDVEMGANTTVDRGAFGDTVIGDGVKLDNLVTIAHNCVVGDQTLICAQCGIAGNTKIGKNVLLSGRVVSKGHLTIGDNVSVGGLSGITKNIPPNTNMKGYPLTTLMDNLKIQALSLRLPEIFKRVSKLEKEFESKTEK